MVCLPETILFLSLIINLSLLNTKFKLKFTIEEVKECDLKLLWKLFQDFSIYFHSLSSILCLICVALILVQPLQILNILY